MAGATTRAAINIRINISFAKRRQCASLAWRVASADWRMRSDLSKTGSNWLTSKKTYTGNFPPDFAPAGWTLMWTQRWIRQAMARWSSNPPREQQLTDLRLEQRIAAHSLASQPCAGDAGALGLHVGSTEILTAVQAWRAARPMQSARVSTAFVPVFGVSILPFGRETGENNPKTTKNSDFARGRTFAMLNRLPNVNRDMYNVTSRV